jgi:hypothetical protein
MFDFLKHFRIKIYTGHDWSGVFCYPGHGHSFYRCKICGLETLDIDEKPIKPYDSKSWGWELEKRKLLEIKEHDL